MSIAERVRLELMPKQGLPDGYAWLFEPGPDFYTFHAHHPEKERSGAGLYFGRHPNLQVPEECPEEPGRVGPTEVSWSCVESEQDGGPLFERHALFGLTPRGSEDPVWVHVWIFSNTQAELTALLSGLAGLKIEAGEAEWSRFVSRECPACHRQGRISKELASYLEVVEQAFQRVSEFHVEIDERQFCRSCRKKLWFSRTHDFRKKDFRRDEANVTVTVTHPGMNKPQRLMLHATDADMLASILSGRYDRYYLDPTSEHAPFAGHELHDRVMEWYLSLRRDLVRSISTLDKHTVEPPLLDFGSLKWNTPARRTLKLINPEKRAVLFSLHGVIAPSKAMLETMPGLSGKAAEMYDRFPYRFGIEADELVRSGFQKPNNKFTVGPMSTVELSIIAEVREGTLPANNEIQVTTYYPSEDSTEPGSRFTVRMVHKGPPGWGREE